MNLADVRTSIDRVDKQIKQLFMERMDLADQVAQVKAETGDEIYKPDREKAVISRLTEDIRPEIRKEYIALIRKIMAVSREYQYGRMLEMTGGPDNGSIPEDDDHNRIRMRVACGRSSGALAGLFSVFADYDVNLTEIRTQTDCGQDTGIEFYLEIEGNLRDKEIQALVFQLEKECKSFEILGTEFCAAGIDEGGTDQ